MERMGQRLTRAALIYLHARDHRDRAIADGLDTIVGTAGIRGQQTVSSRHEGHAGGTKQRRLSAYVHYRQKTSHLPRKRAERATGIEPAWPAWKAALTAPSGAAIGGRVGSQHPAVDRG
jgi:hypothetical protein